MKAKPPPSAVTGTWWTVPPSRASATAPSPGTAPYSTPSTVQAPGSKPMSPASACGARTQQRTASRPSAVGQGTRTATRPASGHPAHAAPAGRGCPARSRRRRPCTRPSSPPPARPCWAARPASAPPPAGVSGSRTVVPGAGAAAPAQHERRGRRRDPRHVEGDAASGVGDAVGTAASAARWAWSCRLPLPDHFGGLVPHGVGAVEHRAARSGASRPAARRASGSPCPGRAVR